MEVFEIDLEQFAQKYALAMNGKISYEDEMEMMDISISLIQDEALDDDDREFFRSAYLMLAKKQKKFLDLKKLRRIQQGKATFA
jgi:hypothetical protein